MLVSREAGRLLEQPLHSVASLAAADIPVQPGLYAWYRDGRLFYVGESRRGLRSRLWGNHIRGNSRGSTLRNKVAKAFGFTPTAFRKYGDRAEAAISRKLRECDIRFVPVPKQLIPEVQADLIAVLDPPMNDHPGESPRWRVDEVRQILGIVPSPTAGPDPGGPDSPPRVARSTARKREPIPAKPSPGWDGVVAVIDRLASSKQPFPTTTGKPNRIVAYERGRRVLVETETGTSWVQIRWIRTHWSTLQRERRISRENVLDPGRRSAFMMALFRLVPGVVEEPGRPTYLVLPRK